MTTTTKNGSAAPGAAAKTETKPTIEKSTATVTPNGIEDSKAKTKVLTVEDRKGRTEILTKLLGKHEHLKDVKQKVEAFAIGSDEQSQTLKLSDSKGNLFQTGNPAVIKEVLTLIKAQVTNQVGVVETEILDFVI